MELVTILPGMYYHLLHPLSRKLVHYWMLGQLYKKKLPDPSSQNEVLKFSTLRPSERLNRIQNGVAGSSSPVGYINTFN